MAIAKLPLAERVAKLKEPALKAKILAEEPLPAFERMKRLVADFDRIWLMNDPPDYEPAPEDAIGPRARAFGSRAARVSRTICCSTTRRPATAVHAVRELRRVQPRLLPRNDPERRLRDGSRRRRRARRHDLRRELFDVSARALGPRPHARRTHRSARRW